MLSFAEGFRPAGDSAAPEVHRRVDDDMLDSGVAMEAAWAWILFLAALAVAIGLFFVYTPR